MSRKNQRLRKELISFKRNAPDGIYASACDDNILRWHFVVEGPKSSPYEGGYYHGEIKFPPQYPFKPPSIWMVTPSGRFRPNAKICMSFTDFHPESWNPAWSAVTILNGLVSFMVDDESTAGSIVRSSVVRRRLARQSLEWNLRNDRDFREHFPDLVELAEERRRQGNAGADGDGDDLIDDDGGGGGGVGALQQKIPLGWQFKVLLLVVASMFLYSLLTDSESAML